MSKFALSEILYNRKIAENIFDMLVFFPGDLSGARAGQIANIFVPSEKNLLPRPVSICDFDAERKTLRFVYQVAGEGTKAFSKLGRGAQLRIIAPLGNGYGVVCGRKKITLVGGGVGVPPLFALAKELISKDPGVSVNAILGFRSSGGVILADEFGRLGANVVITSDDGSVGYKGNAVGFIEKTRHETEIVYACGPKIMLKYLWEYCETRDIPCFVSLEERMACGIGACLGCATLTKPRGGGESQYKRVCKDGPVFNAEEAIWE